ncbi:MAG: choice-of-anchor E domain-containing protein [Thiohalocapsa sp.]|uniref:choice-of-anchor E domain-containing protein n=1 Tax=Thiohalocapsa sp. TaxID=2497641 RepID=UPI0025EB7BDB|nr:choice-of-anchor E domain-containing protein [Thiohalocapsa sp.]MCG6942264.1 choice-of-anchor E domain-containing protein [Thiohalocapsa sp.]
MNIIARTAFAAALAAPLAAQAAFTTPQVFTIANDVPDFLASGQFDEFNDSLGTLVGATWSLTLSSIGGQLEADNDSPTTASVDVELGVEGVLGSVTGASMLNSALSGNIFSGSSILTVSATDTFNLDATTGDNTAVFNATGLADYGQFTGGNDTDSDTQSVSTQSFVLNTYHNGDNGGKIDFTFDINAILDIQVVSGVRGAFSAPNAEGQLSLVYEYVPTDVPVPGTVLLMGGGLLGAGFARRRLARR